MEVKTLAIEVNGVRFDWKAKDSHNEDLFGCPFNGCDLACPYWISVDGINEVLCDKECIIESCVMVRDEQ